MTAVLLAYLLWTYLESVFAGSGGTGPNTWLVLAVGAVVGLLQGIVLWILNDIRATLKGAVTKEICHIHRDGYERRLETLELNVGITGVRPQPPHPD